MNVTYVPSPSAADGRIGTGSNMRIVAGATAYVPNPGEADGKIGTGSNLTFIPDSTPVPNPGEADGILGTGSNLHPVPESTVLITYVPNSNKADGQGTGPSAQPPTITQQPQNSVNAIGSTAVFTVTVIGDAPFQYQWTKDNVDLSDGGNISGATTAILTIDPVGQSDAATYRVIVTNSAGSVTSSAAILTVQVNNPVISLNEGSSTHSSVVIDIINSYPPVTYEVWKSTDGGQTYAELTTIPGSSTSYADTTGMASGTLWMYKMRSVGFTPYSNEVGPAVYMQYGGAVVQRHWHTDPLYIFELYTATVNDDGSAPFSGGFYHAPIANSRGAVLNSAVDAFNQVTGSPSHPPEGNDLYITAGHFDIGGAWVVNPRYYWALPQGKGMGIWGAGMNQTFIHMSSPTTTWGPIFNAFLYADNAVLSDFALNEYFDGPDDLVVPTTDGETLYVKSVRLDATRCRDGSGNVLRGGYLAGGIPDGSANNLFNAGNSNLTFGVELIDSEFYGGGYFINTVNGTTTSGANGYNTSFNRIFVKTDTEFYLFRQVGGSAAAHLKLYNCVIDGHNLHSWGISVWTDGFTAELYAATRFVNRLSSVDDFDIDDETSVANSVLVTADVVYNNVFGPIPTTVPPPTWSVPSLPTPTVPAYNRPFFVP